MGRTPTKDRQEEFKDTKGVIRGHTPMKYIQEELANTKGVIRSRTPKNRQEQIADTKE